MLEFLWPDRGGLSTPLGVVPAGYQRERPCVVVLDNDSVHKSQEIKAHAATLEAVGIHLFYLPPYSPELNLIEGRWRHLKHEALPIRSYTTVETLRQAVEAALAQRASALSVAEAACQVAPGNAPPGCTQIMAEKGGAITRRGLTTRQGAFILTADGIGLFGKSVALPLRDGTSTPSPDHPLTPTAAMPRHQAAGLAHGSRDRPRAA